jgi:hypothetical protein
VGAAQLHGSSLTLGLRQHTVGIGLVLELLEKRSPSIPGYFAAVVLPVECIGADPRS